MTTATLLDITRSLAALTGAEVFETIVNGVSVTVSATQIVALSQGITQSQADARYATIAQGNLAATAVQPSALAVVATSGAYSDLSGRPSLAVVATTGAYSDLSGKPALAAVATSGSYNDLLNQPTISSLGGATAAQGALASTAVQPSSLAIVATSGAYSDLTGKPALATVATSGSYNDLSNQPTISSLGGATAAQGAKADTAVQPAGLTATAVGLGNVNNTSDANKPISTLQQAALDAKVTGTLALGVSFATTTVDTSTAIYAPVQNLLNVAPTAASQAISFAAMFQSVYTSTYNLTAGGHFLGVMGWGVHRTSATVIMGIGVEGRYDHGGTSVTPVTTRAQGVLGLISNAIGTMTSAYGVRSEIQNASGATITNGYGFQCNVSLNAGTFTKFVGYSMPLMTGVVTVPTSMLCLENLETQAPIVSMSPIVNQAYFILSGPATGFSYTIGTNISFYYINPAAALAAGTLTFPLPAVLQDGMEITICSTYAITTFTLNGNGATILNPVTTLAAGISVRYKFFGRGVNIWARI